MDFSSSLKRSFKYRHSRKISASAVDDCPQEHLPILSNNSESVMRSSFDLGDSREVIVKIDGDGRDRDGDGVWRDSSYDFWRDGRNGGGSDGFDFRRGMEQPAEEDPPSKLIGEFLKREKEAGGEMSLDVDLEMDELHHNRKPSSLPSIPETSQHSTSKDLRVSFQSPASNANKRESSCDEDSNGIHPEWRRRPSLGTTADENGGGEVLRCTSFQRRASILKTKTQSRLMDPPELPDRRSGKAVKSGQIRSGMLGRASGMLGRASGLVGKEENDEEDDPLFDEDIPDDFRKGKLDALTLIQWISLFLIVAALICTLSISKWKREKIRGLHLWKWEVLVLVLICGRLVSGWGIRLSVLLIERNFLLRKRVLYFVYGVRSAVQNCIWLGLVLIAWHSMFDEKIEGTNKFLRYVNRVMVCMLVATLIWLVKTLIVKVLASSFHVSKFFDRIQESVFNQYVIETLSGPPLVEIRHNQEEEERTMAEVCKLQNAGATVPPNLRASAFPNANGPSRMVSCRHSTGGVSKRLEDNGQGIPIDHLHRLNPKNVSAWNMKRLMNIVRHGVLSTIDEEVSTKEDESTMQIRSEVEAKRAARKIFLNVAMHGSKFIYLEDLMRFMGEDEALKTLSLLEGSSESKKVSKSALKNWVVNAFRERRALVLTLNDTKTAVKKLHQMVNVLVGIIIVVVCLLILGIATSKYLLFVSSQIVVVTFIFGNTCKTVFEAIVFLFVMHPFDVGDRCEIEGVQMIVEEMNILTTVFLRYDNQKIFYPNSTLATKPISNYYRSPDMGDSVDFCIHIATPADTVALMKQRITNFIETRKDHFYTPAMVVLMNMEDLRRLKMSLWLRHRMNHQDMGERWLRRAAVVEEMVKIFKELDIDYRLHPVDINVRSMPTPNLTRLPSNWTASG